MTQPPPTITEIQSYSWVIRDMFFDKLLTTQFFKGFTPRKSNAVPVVNVPYLGIYIVSEEMMPDGDLNAGEIRFIHYLKLGFSVVIANNDPVACEAKLDQAFWAIMNTLWRDPYLTNMINTVPYTGVGGTPDNTRIEGVSRGARRHVFGNGGHNNETPIGEMQYEATVMYRAEYPPFVTDNLLELSVRTGVKAGDTPDQMAARPQTGADYEFEPYPPPAPQPLQRKE
jgi:hypothetical protein